jgi:hypothetical protein
MGWWSIRKDTKQLYNPSGQATPLDDSDLLLMGDQPKDTIEAALKKVARTYKKDLKRKPTPDELTALLESSIRILEEELFDDMDERELESVVIRLRQRPTRPRPKPGDYFAVPMPGGYGYGRIEDTIKSVLLLVDFLDIFSDKILDFSDVSDAPTLFELVCGNQGIVNNVWPIIGNNPSLDSDRSGSEKGRGMDYMRRVGRVHSYLSAAELLEERFPAKKLTRRYPWSRRT